MQWKTILYSKLCDKKLTHLVPSRKLDRDLEYSTSKVIDSYSIMFLVSKSIFNDRNCYWIHISGEQECTNLKSIWMKFSNKGECKFGALIRRD